MLFKLERMPLRYIEAGMLRRLQLTTATAVNCLLNWPKVTAVIFMQFWNTKVIWILFYNFSAILTEKNIHEWGSLVFLEFTLDPRVY